MEHGDGVGGELGGAQVVLRQQQGHALLLGLGDHVVAVVQPVALQKAGAHAAALGLGKSVGHAAADDDGVRNVQQVVDNADLGGDLAAAEDGHQGPLGIGQGAAHDLQLLLDEEAADRGQIGRHAGGGGVGAVDRAEGVGHVDLGHGRHGLGQLRIVLGLALLKAGVLQQQNLTGLEGGGLGRRVRAHHILGHDYLSAQQLAQPRRHGGQAELVLRTVLGLAQVGAGDHCRALIQQVLNGGQGGADALIVGNGKGVLVLGDVEVTAQEDLLALYVDVLDRLFVVVHGCH